MRLENKMHKWFKFILKMIPFYFLIFSLFNVLFNETLDFDISNIFSEIFSVDNYFVSRFYGLFGPDGLNLLNFNRRLFFILTGHEYSYPNLVTAFELFNYVCYTFEWFIFVDLIDLIFSAFRFIINLAHSWLDSFYEKSKRGGN